MQVHRIVAHLPCNCYISFTAEWLSTPGALYAACDVHLHVIHCHYMSLVRQRPLCVGFHEGDENYTDVDIFCAHSWGRYWPKNIGRQRTDDKSCPG